MNYELYHTHPINKFLHFLCIPLIVLTSCNLLSLIKIKVEKINIHLEAQEILICVMLYNYYNISIKALSVMGIYFFIIYSISLIWRRYKNCIKHSIYIFVCAWILQFIGHAIEGKKPALMDGLSQAFKEAPLFSISYILPFKVV